MAASLVRSLKKFSSFKQLLVDVARCNQVANHIFQFYPVTCIQCKNYHITATYYKQRQTEEREKERKQDRITKITAKKKLPIINIWNNMTVQELANSANRDINDVFQALSIVDVGNRYTKNAIIEDRGILYKAVKTLGLKFKVGKRPEDVQHIETKSVDIKKRPPADDAALVRRHPVVTIMGHVDHGKTTLLDTLRNTSVVKSEFGGITQHIGAFNVTLKSGERVTFLDTPGHAAFSAMRSRGAQATDIVVLVVAADDGVMEQTIQSIEMAKDANVPIIVAINKIDKPEANVRRTQNMLAQRGILVEDLGGDIQSVNISALKGTNLETLTEAIVLQAELMDLKGDPKGLVEGLIIESTNTLGRGKLATVLIQRGTLRRGAILVSGIAWGKVRSMFDQRGTPVAEAKLSEPVEVIGWRSLPIAGDEVLEVETERKAQAVVKFREDKRMESLSLEHREAADKKYEEHLLEYKKQLKLKRESGKPFHRTLQTTYEKPVDDGKPKVNVIIKGDVLGSVEAILDVLDTYTADDQCRLNIVHYGVGPVTATDLTLAETFNAIIYNFNVSVPHNIKDLAEEKKLSIRPQNVIYKLIDDLRAEINAILPQVDYEEIIGEANILKEFTITEGKKKVKVAGCRCTKGVLKKSAMYRLVRGTQPIYTGEVVSLRHLKDEVATIKRDVECGLRLDDPTVSYENGDVLICFEVHKKSQEVEWTTGF